LVQRTSIIRAFFFASHGLSYEPVPTDPVGQSWCGSGALAAGGGALAAGAGAETAGAADALAEAAAPGALLSSFEQPSKASMAAAAVSRFRMGAY
jgi:hypothetical protein